MASLVLTDSSQLTSDNQHLGTMSSKEGSKDDKTAVSESILSLSFTDANIKIEPSDNFLQVTCKLEESTISQASSEESNSLIDADSRETPEELMIIPPTKIEEIYFDDHLDNFSSLSIRSLNHQYAPNIFTMCRYFVKKKLPLPHPHQVLARQTNGETIKQEEEQNPGEFEVDKNIGAVGDNSPLRGFEDLPCQDHNGARICHNSLKGITPEHLNSTEIFTALKVEKHLEIFDSTTIKQNEASISYEKEEKTSANEVIIGSPAKKTTIKTNLVHEGRKTIYGFSPQTIPTEKLPPVEDSANICKYKVSYDLYNRPSRR
uniref:Uncharacterized protein n=1 Tax=Timema shepardi TaxID=629360 RepID=A0A7R9G2T9_TIMSH|nr:unnamed protein product [Timema shepardi]